MSILIFNQRHPLPLILNKHHPQFFLIKNILNLRKKFSDIYCARTRMKSPGILKWQLSVSHWTSARLALARLFARQSSLLKVYSLCMRTVRLKTSECTVNWGEWAGGGGIHILRAISHRFAVQLTRRRLVPRQSAALIQSSAQGSLRAKMYYFSLCEIGDVCPQARRRELLYMLAFSLL